MDRKEFFSKIFIGVSISFVAPAAITSYSKADDPGLIVGTHTTGPTVLDLSSTINSSLTDVGGYVYVGNMIVIRTGQISYIALSKAFTNQGCSEAYYSTSKKLDCTSQGAAFYTSESVLNGPASRPLATYPVTLDGTNLTIG